MKFKIFKFKSVTSTNDVSIDLIKEKKETIGCVLAESQTKGRGTHGKSWISDKGNLFSSIFFPLKKNLPSFKEFSIINPILISKTIKHYCYNEKINFKFPNDILINKKKICGILQEIITLNNEKFLIIGIGINVFLDPNIKNVYKSTNILTESKKRVNIDEIFNLIISSYENFFANIHLYSYENFKKQAYSMNLDN